MSVRFVTQTSLAIALGALVCATASYADNSYQPYYLQDRDNYQFAHVAPILSDDPAMSAPITPNPAANDGMVPEKPSVNNAPSLALGTRSGIDGGIQGSYYSYNEAAPDVKLKGEEVGVTADATVVFANHMFDTADVRFAYGRADYSSHTGTSKNHENTIAEVRDIVGQDFIYNNYVLSPYIGVGFRDLYSDDRGITTLGFAGYRRESQYLYIPIGVKPEIRIDHSDRLDFDLEYDYLAQGWQTSHLGDTGNGDPTIHNSQSNGIGFRGDAMWTTGTWAFGPFVNYWNVNNSTGKIFHSPGSSCGGPTCVGTEPHNMTIEGGLQLQYHFLNF